MLPRNEGLQAAEAAMDVPAARVVKAEARDEMWEGQERHENVKPRVFSEEFRPQVNGPANGNGHASRNGHSSNGNGYSNGDERNGLIFEETDDEIALEIDEFVSSFRKF